MSPPPQRSHGAEASPLGEQVTYCQTYAPGLLFPIPRQLKRDELGLAPGGLPFTGFDLWNAYELSWLGPRGKPVVALAEFRVPADSPCLIESKSLKLYLNSLNQTRFADPQAVVACLTADLSAAAGAPVAVQVWPLAGRPQRPVAYPEGVLLDALDLEIDCYDPTPGLLARAPGGRRVAERLVSHLLKSNCLVTGQPDWAMVVIDYAGPALDHASVLRYLIAFRRHNEFHEQCVERIFVDLQRVGAPECLTVWARYTRRGGLDINPLRSTDPGCPAAFLCAEVRQ